MQRKPRPNRNVQRRYRSALCSLNVFIPKGLKREFKIECYKRDISLNDGVVQAVQDKLRKYKGMPEKY